MTFIAYQIKVYDQINYFNAKKINFDNLITKFYKLEIFKEFVKFSTRLVYKSVISEKLHRLLRARCDFCDSTYNVDSQTTIEPFGK